MRRLAHRNVERRTKKGEQGPPLFLTLRKPTPNLFVSQWNTLPKFVSRAAENLRVPFLAASCRLLVQSRLPRRCSRGRLPRLLKEPKSYGLSSGIKASRYRQTRNN